MTNFNSSTVGKKDLTITYENKVTTIEYRVDAVKLGKFNMVREDYYNGLSKVDTYIPAGQKIDYEFYANGTGNLILTDLSNPEQSSQYSISWNYINNNSISFTQHDWLEQSGTMTIINSETIHIIVELQNTSYSNNGHEYNKGIMILEYEE